MSTRHRPRRRLALVAFAAAAGLCPYLESGSALAADRTWINTAGGTFQTAANWAAGLVAGAGDRAIFDATASSAGYTVSFAGSVVTDALTASDFVAFNLNGNSYLLNQVSSIAIQLGTDGVEAGSLGIANGTLSMPTNGFAWIGAQSGSAGTLNVMAGGTLLFNAGSIFVGTIEDGGMFVSGHAAGRGLEVGRGGTGFLGVNTGATLALTDDLDVGLANLGTCNLSGGTIMAGTLTVGGGAFTGGGDGTMTVGPVVGSVVTVAGQTRVGEAAGSTGNLFIRAGTFSTGSTTVARGVGPGLPGGPAGCEGTIVIGGGFGAARYVNTNGFVVGTNVTTAQPGQGTLIVDAQGTLVTGSLTLAELDASGTAIVRAGTLNSSGQLSVGAGGNGTLLVSQAGVVTVGGVVSMGSDANSTAFVRLQHGGSQLNAGTNVMFVGNSGTAELQVLDGAVLTTGASTVAGSSAGVATITIGGAGSAWNSSGNINIGANVVFGTATLRVQPGGLLTTAVNSPLNIGGSGTVHVDGGTLRAGTIAFLGPTAAFRFNAGTLHLTGAAGLTVGSGGPLGSTVVLDPARTIQTSFGATVANGGILAMRGGRLLGGVSVQAGGQLLLEDATSSVTGSITNAGQILGSGNLAGGVSNNAGGEIRVATGERMRAQSLSNSGQVNLVGGEFESAGSISNLSTGRISGRGLLRSGTGLSNAGTVVLSSGLSDVYGAYTNNGSGITIVTGFGNATFYGDVTNNGPGTEFRVSPGSVATFVGAVSGLSEFTGSGTTIFEGSAAFGRIGKTGATHVGPAGDVIADAIRDGTLRIEGKAAIVPGGGEPASSRANLLQIEPGGRFDLADNALVIDYAGPSPLAQVTGYLAQGYAGGAWNGDGISSSSAAATANRAVGIAEAFDVGSPGSFAGQSIDATSLLLRYTILGDATLNRVVDINDFALLAANYNLPGYWPKGDFNYDGVTGIGDFAILAANFNLAAGETPGPRSAAAVPEPVVGLVLPAAWLARRRGRGASNHRGES